MKWHNYRKYVQQYPWLKQFVGTSDMQEDRNKELLKEWIRGNLRHVTFQSLTDLSISFAQKRSYVNYGHTIIEQNIHYPWFRNGQYYILFHDWKNPKPFSLKFCVEELGMDVLERIGWLKNESMAQNAVIDAIVKIWWVAETMSSSFYQEIDVWIVSPGFVIK